MHAYCIQATSEEERDALADKMCEIERRIKKAVRKLHVTAANVLLALGSHIVLPPAQQGGSAGQRRLAYGKFVERLRNVRAAVYEIVVLHELCMYALTVTWLLPLPFIRLRYMS
jgi:hypothetical protein